MARLEGKLALITGAGRGLGEAIARRFHAEGATVLVNDLNGEAARAVARELEGEAFPADVADSQAVAAMFEAVASRHERLDILVNNAGISGSEDDPERMERYRERTLKQAEERAAGIPVTTHMDVTVELTDEEWARMLAVHLNGTFYCCREALKIMARHNSGAILNIGSIMGTTGGAGAPHYSAAKAGILGFTRALAREVVTRNIRVNAIAPGWIDTEMTAPMAEARALVEAQTPMGRFGQPDDVAWAAVYLASEEARFVTGQTLSPNGGWYMSQ